MAPETEAFAWVALPDELDRSRVTQCALSRICGGCGQSLGRPIAFVATPDEVARNVINGPPLHTACAERLVGLNGADPSWDVVLTSGFEFVRPRREDADRRVSFAPNSLL